MKYIRQRYVLFEIISNSVLDLEKDMILHAIWKQLIKTFGEKITFLAGLWMIRWDPIRKVGILRCDNITLGEVIAGLALITHINNISVIFHTRKTSGTIKKTLLLWRQAFDFDPPKREE